MNGRPDPAWVDRNGTGSVEAVEPMIDEDVDTPPPPADTSSPPTLDLQQLLLSRLGLNGGSAAGSTGNVGLDTLLTLGGGATSAGSGSDDTDRMNLLLRYLEQRNTAPAAETVPTEDEDDAVFPASDDAEAAVREQGYKQRQASARHVKRVLTSLYAEVEGLRTRNDALAAALGACYLCFGDDVECEKCAGGGRPGWQMPDQIAFADYVLPAVRRVRQNRQTAEKPTTNREFNDGRIR